MNSPSLSIGKKLKSKEKKDYTRKLSAKSLKDSYESGMNDNSIELGEEILGEKSTLIRLPGLENIEWRCPLDLLTPNPKQPREYFDPEKMAELEGTLTEAGQKEAIKVVPYLTAGEEVRLFIVDGERRFKIFQKLGHTEAKVSIKWEESLEDILDTSLIMNISRAPHNPIELAKAYQRRMDSFAKDPDRQPETRLSQLVAQRYGISESQVYLHLRFLTLPEEIQKMMIEGKLPTKAVLSLQRGKLKKRGNEDPEKDKLRLMSIARDLVAQLEKPEAVTDLTTSTPGDQKATKSNGRPQKNRLTVAQVKESSKRASLEQGEQGALEVAQVEIHESLLKVAGLSAIFVTHAGRLIAPEAKAIAIEGLRNLGLKTPPEVIRDRLQSIRATVDVLVQLVDEALLPPALLIPTGKPPFKQHLEKFRPEVFGPGIRYLMVCELAAASDNQGIPVPARNMAEKIGVNEKIIGSNIRFLREELPQFDLELEEITIRVKDSQGEYEKIPGYRLKWKTGTSPLLTAPQINHAPTAPTTSDSLRRPSPTHTPATPAVSTHPEKIALDLSKFHILSENKLQRLSEEIARIITRHPHFGSPKLSVRPLIDNRIIVSLKISGNGDAQKLIIGSNIENFDINFKVYLNAFVEAVKATNFPSVKQVGLLSLTSRNQL